MLRHVPAGSYRDLIRRYLLPRARGATSMVLWLVASTALQIAAPVVVGSFIDEASRGAAMPRLFALAGLYLGASLLARAASLLAAVASERVAWQATNALRLDLTRHLLALDRSFHAAHPPGELIERVDGDVTSLGSLLSAAGVDLLGSALLAGGIVAALSSLYGWLGAAFGAFFALTALLLEAARRRNVPLEAESRQGSAAFFGLVGEVLRALEDVRANAGGAYVLGRLRARLRQWMPAYVRAEVGAYSVWIGALVAFGISDATAYAFGARLYLFHILTLGRVYALVAYAAMLAQPLGTMRQRLEELQGTDAAIARSLELLKVPRSLQKGDRDVPRGALSVTFSSVRLRYPEADGEGEPALEDVDLHIGAGRRLGVIGRSGAGKTTLVRLAARLLDPQDGSVLIGGVDARELRPRELRARICYVTQDVQIFSATLRDNLTLFDPAADEADLLEQLRLLGLEEWLGRHPLGLATEISPGSLSAGEAQLVALARVFRKDPGVVLLDEVSSRLDPGTEASLDAALERLLFGRTAVVIAHRPQTLERMDDILVLEGGRMVEVGSREELLRDPTSRYSRFRRAGFGEALA